MTRLILTLLLPALFFVGGCAFGPPLMPGDTEQDVIAKRGVPAGRFQDGDQVVLEYPGGYYGQYSYMARLDQDGRLVSYEQVMTTENFARIRINESTKQDVLRIVGRPSETSWLPLPQFEVWSYRYKESGVWNSIMHIHFDRDGIVRKMENMRDPLFERDHFFIGSQIGLHRGR